MDKENSKNNEIEESQKDETMTDDSDIATTYEQDKVMEHADHVVVKRRGGTFSLLISIVALGLAAYTYYKQWQQQITGSPDEISVLKKEVEQLEASMGSIASDSTENKNAFSRINQLVNEQSIRLSEVENQKPQTLSESDEMQAFDNSANEQALSLLTQQLNLQKTRISQLQNELKNRPVSGVAHEELLLDQYVIDKVAAAQTLTHVQVLVDNQNIPGAIDTLDNFLLVTNLENNWKSKIGQLTRALKSVDLVDLEVLKNQLHELEIIVNNMKLATKSEAQDSKWYERFVSVKKIDNDSGIDSSVELIEIKTAIKRKLYEAKLFLSLQDQNGWQLSLNQASDIANSQLINEESFINQLEALANQQVINNIPDSFDTNAIINELKGLR